MKQMFAALVVFSLLLTTAVFAQQGHRGGGQGARQNAPSAQSRPSTPPPAAQQHQGPPPGRGPSMGMNGARPMPPQGMPQGQAMHRPPMPQHPAYHPYGPGPRYGYGYHPYYSAPAYAYGVPYYNTWGSLIPSFSFSYEKHVDESVPAPAPPPARSGIAYLLIQLPTLDASVYVDGYYEGIVEHFSQQPLPLAVGDHVVEIRGAQSAQFKLRLVDGQTVAIR